MTSLANKLIYEATFINMRLTNYIDLRELFIYDYNSEIWA